VWFLGVLYLGFVDPVHRAPVMAVFVSFMLSNSFRGVPHSTLTSRVPSARERARFMSIQSAVQHFAAAFGAFLSARMLRELPGGGLEGLPAVGVLSMVLAVTFPLLAWVVEARVTAPEAAVRVPSSA